MLPFLNKLSLAFAVFALYRRVKSAQSVNLFLKFSEILYYALLFWLASTFFIYAQSLAMPLSWYLENDRVRLKIFLCLSILLLEVYPLYLFTKWQFFLKKHKAEEVRPENSTLRTLVRLSFIELILTAMLTIISVI